MGNMNYCMFQNTLKDLLDCFESFEDDDKLSADEKKAKEALIKACVDIAENYGNVHETCNNS